MAKYKVPSQAASGADTFSDNLVGRQVTDGTSQLTNTNFALDTIIPEKDSKNFITTAFSEFLTLEDLKEENTPVGIDDKNKRTDTVRFKASKNDANKSLFGSLKNRILASLKNIISKFPASLYVDVDSPISVGLYSASNIIYDKNFDTTDLDIESSMLYNPYDIKIVSPKNTLLANTENPIRDFYSSYKKYVIEVNGIQYKIIDYIQPETSNDNVLTIKVIGKPFTGTTYNQNILIRPNNGIVEEFYSNLDELEQVLLNRDSNPIFTAAFSVPRDSFDNKKVELTKTYVTWPLSKDNWNPQIVGLKYEEYVTKLSDIADEVDDYKSNLMVRFLSSPQLFEFDTEDQKAAAIFQLYGQNFDRVKKFIDNIAYMRNVSYDGVNNIPDVLLKNLSNTLGFESVNLLDEKSIEDLLYTRNNTQYGGLNIGTTLVEAEYEFYRRLLVNLAYIYKSKGTRKSIEFFLKFLGAPEPMIKIDEYVYKVTSMPKSFDIEGDIYDVILSGLTPFSRSEYPIDEKTGLPRRAFNEDANIFFQKGAGWYEKTLVHRSRMILDEQNSILTGRTKTVKSKSKEFTYGEEYFDVFRTFPGLDTGYELESLIDNEKAHLVDDESPLILNRKNISVYLSSARALDYDIFRKSKELELSFGSGSLTPQTGVTFAEFLNRTLSNQVKNSHLIRYQKNYIVLEEIYKDYLTNTGFTAYDIGTVNEFVNRISPYWTKLIEQLIPATTIWTGGNLIENSLFGRSKFSYRKGCEVKTFSQILYPNFELAIEEDLETLLGEENNLRGLIDLTKIILYPIIVIDGEVYGGESFTAVTDTARVVISGITSTDNSARLFTGYTSDLTTFLDNGGCTAISTGTTDTKLPLLCEYKNYVNPDITKIKTLWKDAVESLINNIINNPLDRIKYVFDETVPGSEEIIFTSIYYGTNDCSVRDYIDFNYATEYNKEGPLCGMQVNFTYTPDDVFSGGTENCKLVGGLYVTFTGNTIGIPAVGSSPYWPVYVHANCKSGNNSNLPAFPGGYTTLTPVTISGEEQNCTLLLSAITETDVVDLLFTDGANCDVKVKIEGLQLKSECNPYDPNGLSGYTIEPKVQYRPSFNYGLKGNSKVLLISGATINDNTTSTDIESYISGGTIVATEVGNIVSGDTLLSAVHLNPSTFSNQDFTEAKNNNDYSFAFKYSAVTVTDIDCLGSIKRNIITGVTASNVEKTFEVLPTTKLRVYTNTAVNETDGGIISKKNYFFADRLPEFLQVRVEDEIQTQSVTNTCCPEFNVAGETINYIVKGDYLIAHNGELLEVTGVDLNYCNANIYFHINVQGDNNLNNLILFNGNSDYQLLSQTTYNKFTALDMSLQQYYYLPDSDNCNTIPSINSLLRNYTTLCSPLPVLPTMTPTLTPTLTATPSRTPSRTPSPSATVTPTKTLTATPTPSVTPAATFTPTPTTFITRPCEINISGGYSATPVEYFIDINNTDTINGVITFNYSGFTDEDVFELYVPYNSLSTPYKYTGGTGSVEIFVDSTVSIVKVKVLSNSNIDNLYIFNVSCIQEKQIYVCNRDIVGIYSTNPQVYYVPINSNSTYGTFTFNYTGGTSIDTFKVYAPTSSTTPIIITGGTGSREIFVNGFIDFVKVEVITPEFESGFIFNVGCFIETNVTPTPTLSSTLTATPTVTKTPTPTPSGTITLTPTPTSTLLPAVACDTIVNGKYSATPVDHYFNINNTTNINGIVEFKYSGYTIGDVFEVYVPYDSTTTPYRFTGGTGTAEIFVSENDDYVRVRVITSTNTKTTYSVSVSCIQEIEIYDCNVIVGDKYSPTPYEYIIDVKANSNYGTITFNYSGYTNQDIFKVYVPTSSTTPYSYTGGTGSAIITLNDDIDFIKVEVITSPEEELSFDFLVSCFDSLAPSPTPSATTTLTATPTPSTTLTATPTPSPSTTSTGTPSPTPSVTSTASPTPTPSTTLTATPTPSPTPSTTLTASPTPSPSTTLTATPTPSPTPSVTSTATPTPTPSTTLTATPTPTPSVTLTASPTPSPSTTPSGSPTPSPSPSMTSTGTPTPTPSATNPGSTPDPTATASPTPSPSTTLTASPTPTPSTTLTASPTPTPSTTLTATPTPSPSTTSTGTPTPSPSTTSTGTPTPTPSTTLTATPTPSPTPSVTSTASPTPTPSTTLTATPTPSPSTTSTGTPSPTPSTTLTASPTPSPSPSVTDVIDCTFTPQISEVFCFNNNTNGTTYRYQWRIIEVGAGVVYGRGKYNTDTLTLEFFPSSFARSESYYGYMEVQIVDCETGYIYVIDQWASLCTFRRVWPSNVLTSLPMTYVAPGPWVVLPYTDNNGVACR